MATCIPAFVWKFQFRRVARVRDACLVDAVPPRVKRFRVFVRILFFFSFSFCRIVCSNVYWRDLYRTHGGFNLLIDLA